MKLVRRTHFCRILLLASIALTAAAPALAQQDLQALSQDPKQWPMAPRDYANTRYSALDQINAQNVTQLTLAWSFSLGADRGQEAAPLIVDGTLYVMAPISACIPTSFSHSMRPAAS